MSELKKITPAFLSNLLDKNPSLKGKFAYNSFTRKTNIMSNLPWDTQNTVYPREIVDTDSYRLRVWLENKKHGLASKDLAYEAIDSSAKHNSYHPVKDWLDNLNWDGKSRINYFVKKVMKTGNKEIEVTFVKKWLISAIHRIYQIDRNARLNKKTDEKDNKADHVLCLFSDQGYNKSSFLQALCRKEFFLPRVPSFKNRDDFEALNGKWIGEISEGEALENGSNGAIKAAITSEFDTYRKAYGRFSEKEDRSIIFALTYNPQAKSLINDDSGGRRFWICDIMSPIDIAWIKNEENRNQLWAEIKTLYMSGESHWLESEEDKKAQKETIMENSEGDPWEQSVSQFLYENNLNRDDLAKFYDKEFYNNISRDNRVIMKTTVSEILSNSSIRMQIDRQDKKSEMRVARILSKLSWKKARERVKGGIIITVWTNPESKSINTIEEDKTISLDKFNKIEKKRLKELNKVKKVSRKAQHLLTK